MLEAKAKDQEHRRKCSPKQKQKRSSKIFFLAISKTKKPKKVFKQIFQAISDGGKQNTSSQIFREIFGVF